MNIDKILIGAVMVLIICFLIYISFALISIPFVLLLSLF